MINEDGFRSLSSATISRRRLLGGLAGSAVVLGGGSLLSGCTGTSTPAAGSSASASKTASFGSSASDDVPKRAIAAMIDAFSKKSGDTITINTVPHNDFQNNINTYLQGSPDDAFTWFAGYRMQYYAARDCSLRSTMLGKHRRELLRRPKKASTGDDGKKYLIPNYNYPWGFFYRKSLWAGQGLRGPDHLRRPEGPRHRR